MKEIQSVLVLYKNEGETPLECISRFKMDNTIYKDIPMTYAGRLDPMAEGILLILTGEECKKKDEYLKLDKDYEVEVLLGVSTDTGDILGLLKDCQGRTLTGGSINNLEDLKNIFQDLSGKRVQRYPAYSSKTINGKQLHEWAREGVEKNVEHEIEIYSIEFLGEYKKSSQEILNDVEVRVKKVTGDFRQEEILNSWSKNLPKTDFSILKIRVSCGSGVYMRVLAEEIGEKLSLPALAFSIKRIKVGDYEI
jgi:tRNA pseudouridine(55) synthase